MEFEQLCWSCAKACGGCSWSKNLKPVEGWDAEKDKESYKIKNCPEYKYDGDCIRCVNYKDTNTELRYYSMICSKYYHGCLSGCMNFDRGE